MENDEEEAGTAIESATPGQASISGTLRELEESRRAPPAPQQPDESSVIGFGRQKAAASLNIIQWLFWEGAVLAFWMLVNWALYSLGSFADKHGGNSPCVTLLHRVGPWFIFVVAILHLLRDVVKEVKRCWFDVRTRK